MINCLYCKKEFTPKSKKAVYCCDKCRNYANREKKNLPINERMYFIDHNGVKRLLTRETLTDLLTRFDGVDSSNVIRKKVFDGRPIISNSEFRVPAKPIEEVDYEKLFNDCEFPEERKSLWERIKLDGNMLEKERMQWKFRLNAK